MSELPKTFDPKSIEERWYAHWESRGLFRPDRPNATPWTIVMPPPNVTGSLHIGHALDNTLQDVLTRRERMLGKDALWVVGTDHAGIATQMVVERNLESQGLKRAEIGREAFLEHVWEWKGQSGGAITRQLRRLGASCDWAHERFTMDEGFSKAVIKVFVELYNRKLLYRAKRLVNWDPRFRTAISDLEVENREVQGHMWHFKYPLAGGETYTYVERDADGKVVLQEQRDYISIATTRPETMLGDGAVAVHPGDKRYAPIVGKLCEIPVGPKEHRRLIPIITDEYPDPELRLRRGQDHRRARPQRLWRRPAQWPADVPADGRHRAHAQRRAVLRGIRRTGAGDRAWREGDRRGDRCAQPGARGVPRPRPLRGAQAGRRRHRCRRADDHSRGQDDHAAVRRPLGRGHRADADRPMVCRCRDAREARDRSGALRRHRGRAGDLEEDLVQLAREHPALVRVAPAVVGPSHPGLVRLEDGNIFVAETVDEAQQQAGAGVELRQDEDVLDTWFSSALWPFATLGWPEQTEDLKRHYPNDVLISGFDIIFFWDARMAMQGFEFMGEAPWKTLYLHGLVRDAKGQKMSKSKGNTVDPLGLIDKYGADALRFTLAAMESQGRDIKLDEKRVEGYRNFATKIWNAARFLQMNGVGASDSIAAPAAELPVNRWIIGEVVETLAKLDRAFDELRFDDMADAIYHFVWGTFCDWYVELIKGAFDEETKSVAAWAFDQILVMLHPLMPFITEELWSANRAAVRADRREMAGAAGADRSESEG